MTDLNRTMKSIREATEARLQVLKEGTTCYGERDRKHYIAQYERKLRELDGLMKDVSPARADADGPTATLKRYWQRLVH